MLSDKTDSGETLENPVKSGAEGARRKPNLSGKRIEDVFSFSVFVFWSCRFLGSFFVFQRHP